MIPKRIRALMKTAKGAGHVRLRTVPTPAPRAGEVLVRVRAVGICGTDLHIIRNEYDHSIPLILGHEWAGTIVSLGKGVRGWRVGERVVGELHTKACGVCRLCRSGNEQICRFKRPYGTYEPGALADYFRIPARLLHRIPQKLSFAEATLIEPTACALQGYFRVGGVAKDDIVTVLGHGPIGLILASYLINAKKAKRVYLVGTSRHGRKRLTLARRLGIHNTIDAEQEDPVSIVRKGTRGEGVDVVFEASGNAAAVQQGIAMLRRDGRMGILGLTKGDVAIPWNDAVKKDLDLIFSFSSNAQAWTEAIRAMERRWIVPRRFITDVLPLARWPEALTRLRKKSAIKVVLRL